MQNFTPLGDLILVLPDAEPEKIGAIYIPETAGDPGHRPGRAESAFVGTVVAVGPGDRHRPLGSCACGVGHTKPVYDAELDGWACECPSSLYAASWNADRHEMHVKVGDRVIYPRRPSAPGGSDLLTIDGVGYLMFNEEQSALAVIEP